MSAQPARPRAVEKPAPAPRPAAPLKIKGRPTYIVDDIVDFR
jgi:hypothetical protein